MKGQFQMSNYSPLRYPGGKSALYPIISNIITSNSAKRCIYVEPFAGGASIACHLLVDDLVDYVVINDADRAVYSFWRTVVESPQWIIDKIKTTSVTVDEWRNQRSILLSHDPRQSRGLEEALEGHNTDKAPQGAAKQSANCIAGSWR
ncbi:hypothetical protein B5G28_13365, partial [Faecalibacterium sp. An77]|uniref:DNA adenine methylase n=1 Tax=Faecalibacterium sp. An77 TaxID=1965655 RepID=UPI000B57AAF5